MGKPVKGGQKRAERRSYRTAKALATLGTVAALGAPSVAQAQQQTFYLDRLFMAGAPDDAIGLWRPQMGEKTRFYGQLGLGFGYEPFRLENYIASDQIRSLASQQVGQPVTYQLITYADIGVEIVDRFAIQIELPVILNQGSNRTDVAGLPGDATTASPSAAAAMDLRADARVILYRNDARSFKLAANATLWAPTGNKYSYSGDGSLGGGIGVAAEYDIKKVFFLLNTGFQFRPSNSIGDFSVGPEWRYGVGVFAPLRDGSIRLGAEIFGSLGIGGTGATGLGANAPIEWMGEGRFYLDQKKRGWAGVGGGTRLSAGYAPDFRVVAVIGYSFPIADTDPGAPGKRFKFEDHGGDRDHDKIPDDIDLCPDEPEDGKPPNPDDGCPALPDRDGDGIPDNVDKCPDQPEDFDGIQDADGCPEDDADKDGIPDAQDACPKEPGDADPDPKKNGCPKFIRRISGSTEIQILKVIEFATGRAQILPKSFPILDEVVRLLKVNPEIKVLGIEGHTDNRGSDKLNEKLSDDRAHSVMKYLSEHGIEAGRLTAQGFGPKRPIADNNTNDGRQRNRRVEFHIKEQVGGTPVQENTPGKKPD
jgi:outer membrane protein OmpA-like peptidoglycan-associated protein